MELIAGYTIYFFCLIAALLFARFYKVNLSSLIYEKGQSTFLPWYEYMILTCGLIAFSLGTFILVYVPISYLFPEFVSGLLTDRLIYTPAETRYVMLSNLFLFLMISFIGPVIEEIIFRGVMYKRISSRRGSRVAAITISCFFGILHTDFIGGFVYGMVMTMLYLKTKNLYVPIICHILNNFLTYAYSISIYWISDQEPLYSLEEFRDALVFGSICFILSAPVIIYWLRKNWSI